MKKGLYFAILFFIIRPAAPGYNSARLCRVNAYDRRSSAKRGSRIKV